MAEIWKPVPGYEGMYEASSLGRVRSIDRIVIQGNKWGGKNKNKLKGRVLRENKNGSGYAQVVLSKERIQRNLFVHRIVALCFLGEAPENADVCHNDGDKTNNRIDNLRYGTRKENMRDCKAHGTSPAGERNAMSKLSDSDVKEIREMAKSGMSRSEISKTFKISRSHIGCIINRKRWAHI